VNVNSPAKRKHQGEPIKAKKKPQFSPKAESSKSKEPMRYIVSLLKYIKRGDICRRTAQASRSGLLERAMILFHLLMCPFFADFACNTWWIDSDATVHVTNS
jgi:hypothetical protein